MCDYYFYPKLGNITYGHGRGELAREITEILRVGVDLDRSPGFSWMSDGDQIRPN